MIGEDVTVEIETTKIIDGERETSNVKTNGIFYLKNEKIYVSYSEQITSAGLKVPTLLTIDDNMLRISRRGEVRCTMTFIVGEKTKTQYVTEVGIMDLVINTQKYSAIIGEDDIKISVDYTIMINDQDAGRNSVSIVIFLGTVQQ